MPPPGCGGVRSLETFDPVYLDASHRRGLHGDPDMAVLWYRHARDLGATGVPRPTWDEGQCQRAGSILAWPVISPPSSPTSAGVVQPHSLMLAAIAAI